jgi:hypothetical protein
VEINGKKYYHAFTAGDYPQANITAEDVALIAEKYDTGLHMAPVWIGHPDEDPAQVGQWEPQALAWVGSVLAMEGKLYISFDYVGPEFRMLVESRRFEYVSVEIVKFKDADNSEYLYLYAVGLTNRPAVRGLPPLSTVAFKHKSESQPGFKTEFEQKLCFNESFNKTKTITMNQSLIEVAKHVGLDTEKFVKDESLADAIKVKFTEASAPVAAPAEPAEPNAEVADLQKKLEALQTERVAELVDTAIKEKRIVPAQRDNFVALAKTDFTLAKSLLATMKPDEALTTEQVKSGGKADFSDPKFKDEKGGQITYEKYLGMSLADRSRFTKEEVDALRDKSSFARN